MKNKIKITQFIVKRLKKRYIKFGKCKKNKKVLNDCKIVKLKIYICLFNHLLLFLISDSSTDY